MVRSAPRGADVRLENIPAGGRRSMRKPQHVFRLKCGPWMIHPFCIAPVLAGDTLRSASIQARVLSDLLASYVSGWWAEMYLFYIRVGDLVDAETVRQAIIDPSANMDALASAAQVEYMHQVASRPSWVKECLRQVTHHYFREEGEVWDAHTLIGFNAAASLPASQITGRSWLDSVQPSSALTVDAADDDDWERKWTAFQQLRNARLTTATWEEYLAVNGVNAPPLLRPTDQEEKKPELLRFIRQYQYPRMHLDPTTGAVGGFLEWHIAERLDKSRFFDQPGFIFGVTVFRPKVYLTNQKTAAVDVMLHNAEGWMPAEFETDPHTRVVEFQDNGGVGAGLGPIHGATVDYWVDRADLFLYGDQFVNFDLSTVTNVPKVALPDTDASPRKYPVQSDVAGLWHPTLSGEAAIDVDGIASFQIASRIGRDATVGGSL